MPAASVTLVSVGSVSMNPLILTWMNEFKQFQPQVDLKADGKGAEMGPLGLVGEVADFAAMSRPMRDEEIAQFVEKFGYPPTRITVAVDGLVLLVHESNPLRGVTLPQIEAIYSCAPTREYPRDITAWGQLGLKDDWQDLAIVPYARFGWHGHEFFKERVLVDNDFRNAVVEGGGSSLFPPIAVDWRGIVYSAAFLTCQGTRAVPLAVEPGTPFFEPTYANLVSGEYPLSRWLYIYVNRRPGQSVSQPALDFLRYVLSDEGQQIVVQQGFGRIPRILAAEQILELSREIENDSGDQSD